MMGDNSRLSVSKAIALSVAERAFYDTFDAECPAYKSPTPQNLQDTLKEVIEIAYDLGCQFGAEDKVEMPR